MKKLALGLGIGVLLAALVGCQPAMIQASPQATAMDQAPQSNHYVSKRYRYSINYPIGWQMKEIPGSWTAGEVLLPGNPGADTFSTADTSHQVAIARQPLLPRATLDGLVNSGLRSVEVQMEACGSRTSSRSSRAVSLGGVSARMVSYYCADEYMVVFVFALVNQDGVSVTWVSPLGREAQDQASFERILGSLHWGE